MSAWQSGRERRRGHLHMSRCCLPRQPKLLQVGMKPAGTGSDPCTSVVQLHARTHTEAGVHHKPRVIGGQWWQGWVCGDVEAQDYTA
eukprot:4838-Eustigmatos_ZCMA.PRE.1